MDQTHFPWRPLGRVLVDEGLLTEAQLEQALNEQRRTGRLLGQILVDTGYLTAFSLALVLAEQHGVQLRPSGDGENGSSAPAETEPASASVQAPAADGGTAWRPLGKLLVESGFLTEEELEAALEEQRRNGGSRLGEILVARGTLSGPSLARALALQHGVELGPESELADNVQTVLTPTPPGEPVYHVCEVMLEPTYQTHSVLYQSANFLEAVDYAFEFVDAHDPPALEIQKADGDARETVWMYSESRAAAAAANRKDMLQTFGFNPTNWDAGKDFEPDPAA